MKEKETEITEFAVAERHSGWRLDRYLADIASDHSRAFFQRLIKSGFVEYGQKKCLVPKTRLEEGKTVRITWPKNNEEKLLREHIALDILYEDDDIIVINKPSGIVIHPAAGNIRGTIVNALLGRDVNFAEKLSDRQRPGIVHRLDKDTSGCLVIAKNLFSKEKLSRDFSDRKVNKTYLAFVCGFPEYEEEEIVTLIGRHPVNRKKMAVLKTGGRKAITCYKLMRKGKIEGHPVSMLRIELKTGRTHQIRVHLAYRHIPVLGDKIYGGHQKIKVPRQMLHAWKIRFQHPATGSPLSFESPFPPDFSLVLNKFSAGESI